MPWKATSPVDLRHEFMNRLCDGEKLVDLCQEYGISRKTGQKYKARFEAQGVAGLYDQPRAPKVIPHKTPQELVDVIVEERKRRPSWGPKKLKEVLEERLGRDLPAASTSVTSSRRLGSSSGVGRAASRSRLRRDCARPPHRTRSGASTTRGSFSSATVRTATRSR
jgi:transposase